MARVDNSELESINWTIAVILLQVAESNNACRGLLEKTRYDRWDTSEHKCQRTLIRGTWSGSNKFGASRGESLLSHNRCLLIDKISTSLVECERVKAKIGKALRADGSPCVWKKFPHAHGQKGFLS